MIFGKKKVPDLPKGLKEAPETLDYKRDMGNPNFKDSGDFSSNELPELKKRQEDIGLPPLQKPVLDLPPKEEKKIKKLSKEKEIFVKIDNFKDIVQSIENMEKRLNELESLIVKLQKLNDSEVSEINAWKSDLDEVRVELKNIGENLAQE